MYGFLADTWWYGLTNRLSEADFVKLARLRVSQGVTAVQLVAGIPPEIGPLNQNAASASGFPWTLDGSINEAYLALAARRTALLNDLDLTVIAYGAWGHQLDWIGVEKMSAWWEKLAGALEPYDVIFCLTGKPNLLLGQADRLLPDRTMADLDPRTIWSSRLRRYPGVKRVLKRLLPYANPDQELRRRRKTGWGAVLKHLAEISGHPIIVHTNSGALSVDAVENSSLLAAITTQSGHSKGSRNALWQIPIESSAAWPDKPFINLEPWYEGITDDFYAGDQLYAYWSSMLAGAASFCYGAQGIWNVGDGRFLAYWGKQTFEEAMMLDTPRLIGLSHRELQKHIARGETETRVKNGELISISLTGLHSRITYYPEISRAEGVAEGSTWLPLQGRYVARLPQNGQVVQFSNV